MVRHIGKHIRRFPNGIRHHSASIYYFYYGVTDMALHRNSRKELFVGHFKRNIFYRKYNWLGQGYTMMESVIIGAVYIAAFVGLYFTW